MSGRRDPIPRRPYPGLRHLRATALLLLVTILLTGLAYPLAIVGFGELVRPDTAGGALTHNPNGSVNGSRDLPPGTNTTFGGPLPAPGPARAGDGPGETVSYARPVGGVVVGGGTEGSLPAPPAGVLLRTLPPTAAEVGCTAGC